MLNHQFLADPPGFAKRFAIVLPAGFGPKTVDPNLAVYQTKDGDRPHCMTLKSGGTRTVIDGKERFIDPHTFFTATTSRSEVRVDGSASEPTGSIQPLLRSFVKYHREHRGSAMPASTEDIVGFAAKPKKMDGVPAPNRCNRHYDCRRQEQ